MSINCNIEDIMFARLPASNLIGRAFCSIIIGIKVTEPEFRRILIGIPVNSNLVCKSEFLADVIIFCVIEFLRNDDQIIKHKS